MEEVEEVQRSGGLWWKVRQGCCTLEGQGMGHGTQSNDWKLGKLESMELSLCSLGCSSRVIQSVVANHHECQTGLRIMPSSLQRPTTVDKLVKLEK